MHRLLVSAAHKSSGKTTLSIGLCAALAAQGRKVQPFKKGPDYIDPLWLTQATGRACQNLDPYLSEPPALTASFSAALPGADLAWVEGNHGLHDGLALDGSNSNAAVAKALGAPVLLVLDVRGMTRGVAPLLLGTQAFDREVKIGGVILNRVGGARHEAKLRAVIEHYTDVPVLGAVAEDSRLAVVERHLGLMPANEAADPQALVQRIGAIVASQVNLSAVQALAARAAPWPGEVQPRSTANGERVRIAIARDRAFGFYYPDDLQALQQAGAELCFFDTLHSPCLPAGTQGLFIGGGFPETCMAELQANAALRADIARAIEAGLPTYAECGGLMYLARRIRFKGQQADMVGVIPADAVMQPRPVGRGYVHLRETTAMPWPGQAPTGAALRGHEFHHSRLEGLPEGLAYAYQVERGHGIDGDRDGLLLHNLLASYTHLRDAAGSGWATRFVEYVRREGRTAARAARPVRAGRQADGPLAQSQR